MTETFKHNTQRHLRAGVAINTLAEDLDGYLRARAEVEGVTYKLSPEFFTEYMNAGIASFFGIDVDLANCVMVRDRQEPRPGVFEAWLKSKTNPA